MRAERLACATVVAIVIQILHAGLSARANDRHDVRGMVMKIAPSQKSFIVSHDTVPGVMDAMMMSFDVRDPRDLDSVRPGAIVTFTLVVEKGAVYAERVRVRPYEPLEQDPLTARRLAVLKRMTGATAMTPVAVGQAIPDFTLTDQARRPVALSAFRGKVVAVNFVYTSCALPQFCFRIANNFGVLQRRFKDHLGRELVLLTVTFDPERDRPEQLAEYATQWNANPETWRFLTGTVPDVRRVCGLFGVDFFPDEGLINHSSRTAVIDRQGRLVANIEGNEFTPVQLGDLVQTALELGAGR